MKCLYVLFDADCELCMRCRNWLMQQPAFVPLVFIAFQSDEAQRRFPGIDALKPGEQLLGISDEGAVYRGAHAWIMCLWALEDYREHAQRLAHPVLLPLAKAVCELLSRNRFFLSDALFRQEPHSAARKRGAHYGLHNATWANAGCRRYEPTKSALKRGVNETFASDTDQTALH